MTFAANLSQTVIERNFQSFTKFTRFIVTQRAIGADFIRRSTKRDKSTEFCDYVGWGGRQIRIQHDKDMERFFGDCYHSFDLEPQSRDQVAVGAEFRFPCFKGLNDNLIERIREVACAF